MKKIKTAFIGILTLAIAGVTVPVKKAHSAELAYGVAMTAVTVYAIGIGLAVSAVGGLAWATTSTVKHGGDGKKEMQALKLAQEDAAAFVSTNGEYRTQLLDTFFTKAREGIVSDAGAEEEAKLSDLDIAKILLQYEPNA